jgi:membrane carboxypeptidase/penicillin-binding protein
MLSEGYITQAQYDQARSEAIDASYHTPEIAFSAPYLSEMCRNRARFYAPTAGRPAGFYA